MVAVNACRGSIACWIVLSSLTFATPVVSGAEPAGVFRAGAAAIDISPRELPVKIAGSFFPRAEDTVQDPLHARCLVLDDGATRVAILTIDTCVIGRDLLDEAKRLAHQATGIPKNHMLMSATHTHSAPAVERVLGTGPNTAYRQWLPERIARAVEAAASNLAPAQIGWTVVQVPALTHCRRWIRRPDRIDVDPFGYATIRAMMHPGYQNPDYLGPAGPVDPDLSILSVRSPEGRPVALLANYSMHYVGAPPISSDYFGLFADRMAELVGDGVDEGDPPFVAIMSNGTSGDLHWMDYSQPKPDPPPTHITYADAIAHKVRDVCRTLEYHDRVPLAIRETTLTLRIRPITDEELAAARERVATFEGREPKTLPELYALAQVGLSEETPERELVLQALRVGELGIAAIPCEVFGLTGLQIKALSPLRPTFTIELANGYDGYIPPPAQHTLGGYTTWRTWSACLEVEAAPKITERVTALLEEVAGQSRRTLTDDDYPFGQYPRAVRASNPLAYWRFHEFDGPRAFDASGEGHDGTYEPGIAFYLEGPTADDGTDIHRVNRAPHFAGGRVKADIENLGDTYTVQMWFSNYLPVDVRPVTGYLFSRGPEGVDAAPGDHLAIGGTSVGQGRLLFYNGDDEQTTLVGETQIPTKRWNHVALVRVGRQVTVYLNGRPAAELTGLAKVTCPPAEAGQIFIGGRSDDFANFEGRIDEVALFDRPLPAGEIAAHYRAATGPELAAR